MAGEKVTQPEASGRPGPSQQEGCGSPACGRRLVPVWRMGPEELDAPGRVRWAREGGIVGQTSQSGNHL